MNRKLVVVLALLASSASYACAQGAPAKEADKPSVEAWWTEWQAGLVGGSAGGTVGILGGVIGTLGGIGVARRFVLSLSLILIALGAAAFLVGLAAVAQGQPYHVYYPLLLIGGILVCVLGFNFPMLKRRYEQRELQKIAALDS